MYTTRLKIEKRVTLFSNGSDKNDFFMLCNVKTVDIKKLNFYFLAYQRHLVSARMSQVPYF